MRKKQQKSDNSRPHVVVRCELKYHHEYAPAIVGPFKPADLVKAASPPRRTDPKSPADGKGQPPPAAPDAAAVELEPIEVVLAPGFPHEVRVIDERGEPIAGAQVAAMLNVESGSSQLQRPYRTGADGRVVIPHVLDEEYEFEVTVHAFRFPDDAVTVRPKPGVATTIQLARASIPGVALDEDGRPMRDVVLSLAAELDERIEVEATHSWKRVILAKSDEQGRFVLPALHDDSLHLIKAEGIDGSLGFARGVRRRDGEVKISMRPRKIYRGVVVGKSPDTPLVISIRRSFTTGFEMRGPMGEIRGGMVDFGFTRVQENGDFEFPAWGCIDTELRVFDRAVALPWPPPEEPLVIEAPPGPEPLERTVRLNLVAEPSVRAMRGTMKLRLTNNPPERTLQGVERQVEIEKGVAQFRCLARETFSFDSSAIPGYWTVPGSVDAGPAGDRAMDVRVFPAGSIAGRVVEADGSPAGAGIKVVAEIDREWAGAAPRPPETVATINMSDSATAPAHPNPILGAPAERAETDDQGRFEIPTWPQGVPARITVERGRSMARLDPIKLDAAEPRRTVEVRLPRRVAAAVRLLDPEGKPISGASLIVMALAPDRSARQWPFGVTDSDGRCSVDDLGDAASSYTLLATFPADFQPIRQPLVVGGPSVDITARRGRVLEARVVEAVTGWPVPKYSVYAVPSGEGEGPILAETDDEGRFRISTLPDGPVRLQDNRLVEWVTPQPPVVTTDAPDPVVIRLIDLHTHDPQPRGLVAY